MAKNSSIEKNKRREQDVEAVRRPPRRLKAIAKDKDLSDGGALRGGAEARRAAAQLVARRASATAAKSPAVRAPYYRKLKMSAASRCVSWATRA